MPEKYPLFGARVRDVLRAKRITFEKFAELVDISDSFSSKIVSGSAPSFQNFLKIVEALGVSADYLIQDYISVKPVNPNGQADADPLELAMSRTFSTLTKEQQEEVFRLAKFLGTQQNS